MNNKYKIYKEESDYKELDPEDSYMFKGRREKRLVELKTGKLAILKIRDRYNKSEECSEKIASEIAKTIGYNCAQVELAETKNGQKAALSILFTDTEKNIFLIEVGDLLLIRNNHDYGINKILSFLEDNGEELLRGFIRQMIFDALIGEQDRHWQNWGFLLYDQRKEFAPFYDNADSLMSEFLNRDQDLILFDKTQSSPKFEAYINRSKMMIYNENDKRFKSFEMISYLSDKYQKLCKQEAINLLKIDKETISSITNKIPDSFLTNIHKDYIIKYILRRNDIILGTIYG